MSANRPLTHRQEAFAVALASGMSQRAAYAAAGYSVRGPVASVDSRASRLAADERVQARVRVLRAHAAEVAMWTVVDAADALKETLRVARAKVIAAECPDVAGTVPDDVPREATRAVLGAVAELNRLFGIPARTGTGTERVIIIDDL